MIPIKNIYYMLSYAFSQLQASQYKSVEMESFKNVSDICAAILIKGVSLQIKRGIHKDYIEISEALSTPKGKINVSESVKTLSIKKQQLYCIYDDFSVNSYLNKIIKSTMLRLIKSDIELKRKKELKKLLMYFSEVDVIDLHNANWNFRYNRNNQTYRLLISICYMVLKDLIQTQSTGKTKAVDFLDEQRMCRLYEKFILEYYKKEVSGINANASKIEWQLADGESFDMLPEMKTDIMLSDKSGENILIIDAKYYGHTTQVNKNKHTLHSNNLYQIFTYVKNKEAELKDKPHNSVSGMLVYAKTDEQIQPNNEYTMSGNKISVKTLDLNCDFEMIKEQLNQIAQPLLND